MKKRFILIAAAVCLAIGVGSFFGGVFYAQHQAPVGAQTANRQRAGQMGVNGAARTGFQGNRGTAAAGFVSGDIVVKDAQSLTLKSRDGSTKIIFYSPSAEISKFAAGTASDLTAGQSVVVTGKTNPDGSLTAQTIQIRPAGQNQPPQPSQPSVPPPSAP